MRKTIKLAMFIVILHAAAGFLAASGVAADMGVYPDPGGDGKVDTAKSDAQSVEAQGGVADTLFALYTSATKSIIGVFRVIFALEIMLDNIGIPVYVTAFVTAPVPIIAGLDIYYALTGRDL